MALMDLKSDLSWYGKKAPGFTPSTNRSDTKYINDGASPAVEVSGFDDKGNIISPVSKMAVDSFVIGPGDTQGYASRAAQLGTGTKFPILNQPGLGDFDTSHTFDVVRTGFSKDAKYGDAYGVKFKNSGLADTYTANSPIDDMYDKFNLRDDATPNPGYAKQPFILRGIQREGSSDPQRWGLGETTVGKIFSTFDLPRGGILTAAERSAIDVARIGKFLISPRGIGFLARQFGYQLMNPNLENAAGIAAGLPATQLYNPLSAPIQAIGNFIGVHAPRHGIPFITGGPLGGGGEYEDKKRLQNITWNLGAEAPGSFGFTNRLNNLRFESFENGNPLSGKTFSGGAFITMTGPKGPGSILGIGATAHTRTPNSNTSLEAQWGLEDRGGLSRTDYEARRFKYGLDIPKIGDPLSYQTYRGITGNGFTQEDIDGGFNLRNVEADNQILAYHLRGLIENQFNFVNGIGGGRSEADTAQKEIDYTGYKTNDYEKLKTQATDRPTLATALNNDFLSDEINTYENTEEASRIMQTSTYEVGDKKQSGDEEAQKTDNSGPLTPAEKGYYKVLGYAKLTRDNVRSFSDDAKGGLGGTKYASDSTLEGKYGSLQYLSSRTTIEEQTDPIQILEKDYEANGAKDLINFKFQALRTTDSIDKPTEDPIIFRAFLNSVDDSFAPSWDENQDQGRADAKIMLSGWSRSISVDFIVPVQSKGELSPVYKKLDALARLTYPIYASSGFTGTYVKTTIGDLYKGEAMYVTDLSYSWDNETPWELEDGSQLPFYTNVSMTLGWIGKQRPEYNTHVFTYNATT